MNRFIVIIYIFASAFLLDSARGDIAPPNVVIIFTDDQGWGDVGCYGSEKIRTPHLDKMAVEGIRFTDFHVAAAVCSASRAALLTGRYPARTGVTGVIGAETDKALPLAETTLAERFKTAGFATGIFGKWHLGNSPDVWPLKQGFDEWFGTIGSNDMGKNGPSLEQRRAGKAGVELVDMETIVETNPDQGQLTRRYTEKAIDFIERNKKGPFFVYIPHNMPHTPLFVSESFQGKSKGGLYGDTIEEIDWSVGEILGALERLGIEKDTIVLFSSDNGPWLIFGDHGGSAGPFSGGKKQTLEGGMRVPLIARWPGRIPASAVCDELVTALDLTPTLMTLTGVESDIAGVDGVDVSPWWLGTAGDDSKVERKPFFHFWERELQAVRNRQWKLRLAHIDTQVPDPAQIGYGGERGAIKKVIRKQALFDLDADPGESNDLSKSHPKILQRMKQLAEEGREIARQAPN